MWFNKVFIGELTCVLRFGAVKHHRWPECIYCMICMFINPNCSCGMMEKTNWRIPVFPTAISASSLQFGQPCWLISLWLCRTFFRQKCHAVSHGSMHERPKEAAQLILLQIHRHCDMICACTNVLRLQEKNMAEIVRDGDYLEDYPAW